MDSPEFAQENKVAQERVRQTHQLVSTLSDWALQMLRLSTSTLIKILKLGSTIQRFLK